MVMLDIDHVDYSIFTRTKNARRPRGNQGTKKKLRYYKDLWCCFDIETTNDLENELSFMYVWQLQVDDFFTVFGRTWEQFLEFLRRVKEALRGNWLVIYIHNINFEFSFLKGIYNFSEDEVFCMDLRKVLKCDMMDAFEFRCSYLQTNMSLDAFAKQWGKTRKMSGKRFNYKKMRYPWTRLTRKERKYIQNDVISVVEAMKNRASYYGDSLYTIPLTSTGYIRRTAKRSMKGYNHRQLVEILPGPVVMKMLLEGFRGGNVHANRYYVGEILKGMQGEDIASSYPTQQCCKEGPMGIWSTYTDPRNLTLDSAMGLMQDHYALIMRIALWDVKLQDPMDGFPYLARHKCRNISGYVLDNGRVLAANYLETTVTDVDFRIIITHYDFTDIRIMSLGCSSYKPLPPQITDVARDLFKAKTALKGGDPLQYALAKASLNSIYGMSVTNPVKVDIHFVDGLFEVDSDYNFEEKVKDQNRRAFQSYAWGVWITAHARKQLQDALDMVGYDAVYCDTDSVKYLGDHKKDFEILNEKLIKQAKAAKAYATDPKGKIKYMGVFEHDSDYDFFKTLGSKRYAYISNGKLGLTVSGVTAGGAEELEKAGGLKAFKDGMCFRKAGGVEAVYNDLMDMTVEYEGRPLRIRDNVLLRESTYTLGLTQDYIRILENPQIWLTEINDKL